MWKKILTSKYTRYVFSLILLYFAFKKVNIASLTAELVSVPWWTIPVLLAYLSITMFIGGWRWAVLVLSKVGVMDILRFTKANYLGGFYGMFFPSPFVGDLIKWTSLLKGYPAVSKIKMAGTVLIDRIIGFTALCFVALISLTVGKYLGYSFPSYLWWLFILINLGMLVFYGLVLTIDFEKIVKSFKRFDKLGEIAGLLVRSDKKDLLSVFCLCLISEPLWMATTWFIALIFGVDLKLIEILIFMPIISLILVLPISVAGFGARETLFVYFFSRLGLSADQILAVSTFNGILGIFNSLIGGLMVFF